MTPEQRGDQAMVAAMIARLLCRLLHELALRCHVCLSCRWCADEVGCPSCCASCESATGGQCRQHVQPECVCYEPPCSCGAGRIAR